ncbi:acetyl-CoA carboxylase biotin carboxylase subunit [Lentilactobacillus parafarraginis]|jgi:acetyl-CoA carboxylase biotin carboxylase subunit|uniref:biotin carboxylase n=2 Tax=Lentilactobacillus parafarraginis TaxID=390842 RepID=A0A0R1YU69_9LACO|nr:acetyl-CoA carboxylase biotin carboxylase subunit [Lentilactobacillus parafarraginis]KRM45857.1 acetyl-CoA carboxylase, biotin carboxylase subunit [Lentilactobacillus parafarraginis DSM 18390 = JCM 14109]TLQ19124.1 acetyl-CoA carboxylase biotin carboxylase subunit [Lentilactobacillus parafarraginis]
MFKKVLVANRGEIAVQIIRALHDLNIEAVAVYSSADKDSLFVHLADEAICIGGPQPGDSYLNMTQIISAATLTGCQAIHPGYGFLSENAEFAQLCETCHIKFIGPSHQLISLMGDKANAREAMKSAGVPVIPGSEGDVTSIAQAEKVAERIGFPVLLKSAAGGGGKGIREVDRPDQLRDAFAQAQREARASFDDDSMYVEKLIRHAKHVEMQVIADEFGHVVYLPERDCSLQRNHQKVIEESPCVLISAAERQKLGEIVANATLKLGYTNTGTYEFLMDDDHHFYFMEMNTRLQVEHTITEEVTGIELVKGQLEVASGEALSFTQEDAAVKGHALECRLNAEDPDHNFAPQPGKITHLFFPDGSLGVRIDSGVTNGSFISPFYDSMIAKLIVHLNNRDAVISKMKRVLGELEITGVTTNQSFLYDLIATDQFNQGTYSTSFIENDVLNNGRGLDAAKSV